MDPTGLKQYPSLSQQQMKCLKSKDYPVLIILCGVPGSGKSLFCRILNTVNRQQFDHKSSQKVVTEWRFANQDDLGKKEDVEMVVKRWISDKKSTKMGLVIDRCNVLKSDRKHWIEFAFKPKRAICIDFDISSTICCQRIRSRKNHPTISSDRSERGIHRLVNDFMKSKEVPTRKEGFQMVCTYRESVP